MASKKYRTLSRKYWHLYNRAWALTEFIEEVLMPDLKTTRKKRCAYLLKRVNNLLK